MPRKIVPVLPQCPYHISARCQNREWFDLDMTNVWSVMEDYLYLAVKGFNLRLHAFVLMSNHYHLMVTAPEGNLSEALQYLQRETSRELGRLTGRINHLWGGRNHKSMLGRYHHFMNAYKYVYRNPVRARMCERVEEYPFSTLHGLLGLRRLVIPVEEDTILFNPDLDESALAWLNTKSQPELDEEMRLGLRRPVFSLKSSARDRRESRLELELI